MNTGYLYIFAGAKECREWAEEVLIRSRGTGMRKCSLLEKESVCMYGINN
jgi:hypothetical protein